MWWTTCALAIALQAPQEPLRVRIVEVAPVARRTTVRATVPFARGELRLPPSEAGREPIVALQLVDGEEPAAVPGVPLWRWPDGSAGAVQVHANVPGTASRERTIGVLPIRDADGVAARAVVPPHRSPLREPLSLWTELVDPWGRRHVARLEPDATAGPDGVLFDSGLVRARRFRAVHRLADGDGAGRPFLPLCAWLLTFDGERHAELTLQLDNTRTGADSLGPVRLQGFAVCTGDPDLRFVPLFAREQWLPEPVARAEGGFVQALLPPAEDHYLGERTAKTFRVILFQDDATVTAEERAAAAWAPWRLWGFPDLDHTRATRAFGAHGGPAPLYGDETGMVPAMLSTWRLQARFGPFGDFGDPANSGAAGHPRNGPSALHNVLRWRSPELAQVAEGMVLQHSLRPTPGCRDQLPADMAAWRRGLGPVAIAAPHGFTVPDYEHLSVLLPYDWWWLTGDPYARDELARIGSGLRGLLQGVPFLTCRGEGWCLQSGVLIARATGDQDLLAFLRTRVRDTILPAMADPRQAVLAQPAHVDVLDGREPFDAPWQMAALVHGLHALWSATDDPDCARALLRTADVMADSGWVPGRGPKTFVAARDASRYSIAALPADEDGTAIMTIGAFVLAAEVAVDPETRRRLQGRADHLFDRLVPANLDLPGRRLAAANVWLQIASDRRSRNQ